jgi:hypothetical protein
MIKLGIRAALVLGYPAVMLLALFRQSIVLAIIGLVMAFAGVQPRSKFKRKNS